MSKLIGGVAGETLGYARVLRGVAMSKRKRGSPVKLAHEDSSS